MLSNNAWLNNIFILFGIYIFLEAALKSENFIIGQYIFDSLLKRHNITNQINSNDQCINNSMLIISEYYLAQSENSLLNTRLNLYKGFLGFFSVLFFGLYSDKNLSKKRVLMISFFGIYLAAITNLLIIFYELPVEKFLYTSVIQGFFSGGEIGIVGFIIATFSDLSEEKETRELNGSYLKKGYRVFIISLFGGLCPLLSSIISPLNGYLLARYSFLSVLLSMYSFLIPSTLLMLRMNMTKAKRSNSCSSSVVTSIASRSLVYSLLSNESLVFLQISLFIINLVDNGVSSFLMTFLRSIPFCWTTEGYGNMDGLTSGLIGFLSVALNLAILCKLFRGRRIGTFPKVSYKRINSDPVEDASVELEVEDNCPKEPLANNNEKPILSNVKALVFVMIAGTFRLLSLIIFSKSLHQEKPTYDWFAIFAMIINSFSYCTEYLLRGFTSNIIPNSHHGFLFSLYSAFQLLNTIAGNVIFSYIYSYTVLFNAGTSFTIAAAIYSAIFPLIGITIWRIKRKSRD